MEQFIKSKKYPKSISGKQCVGPCYKKNTKILHPTYLNIVSHIDNFCPIAREEFIINGKKEFRDTDNCNEANINKTNIGTENTYNLLFPYVDFNPQLFLKLFYNINTFGQVIEWIDTNKTLLDTQERIFNLGIDSFKKNLDNVEISDNRIVDFIYELFNKKYFNIIIIPLFQYIIVADKYTKLGFDTKKDTDETIIIKTNYIKKNILNINNISNFIKSFFNKKISSDVNNTYSMLMVDNFSKYIINDIKQKFIK
jgi:hypothetical protein